MMTCCHQRELIAVVVVAKKNLVSVEIGVAMSDKQTCKWTFDDLDCYYETSCGQSFCFSDDRESLTQDGFKFCPYCGEEIEE